MKAYTDLEQSKRLAEILSLESADACWTNHLFNGFLSSWRVESTPPQEYKGLLDRFVVKGYLIEPAWSLSALLNIINNIKGWYPGIDAQVEDNKWQICMFSRETGSDTDLSSIGEELVDVCYDVIVKLHNKNLI